MGETLARSETSNLLAKISSVLGTVLLKGLGLGQGRIIPLFCPQDLVNPSLMLCCSKVIMSGGISNVIMSGCGDDNPDDERR